MSKRKSAAAAAVEFFQTADIGVAREILAICINTVKQRGGAEAPRKKPAKSPRVTDVAGNDVSQAPGVSR